MLSLLKNMPNRLLILTIVLVIANMGTAASMQIFVETQDHGTISLQLVELTLLVFAHFVGMLWQLVKGYGAKLRNKLQLWFSSQL